MDLIPFPVGPLNPKLQDVLVALLLFAVVHLVTTRLLPRVNRVLASRDDAIHGTRARADELRARAAAEQARARALLAEARHDAARIRQQAHEEGAALIAEARADGLRKRDALIAEATAGIEADRATAEAELRVHAAELASDLASRIVGEPVRTPAEHG
jgi:F-type H+-transporting ATPase subunit b